MLIETEQFFLLEVFTYNLLFYINDKLIINGFFYLVNFIIFVTCLLFFNLHGSLNVKVRFATVLEEQEH